MAKKKNKKSKKLGLILIIVGVVGILSSMHHFGFIAFSGNGELGWGTAIGIEGTENNQKFYFSQDKIYQGKTEISKQTFYNLIKKTKSENESIDLFFIRSRLTNKFYEDIKRALDKSQVVFSEKEINQMPQ